MAVERIDHRRYLGRCKNEVCRLSVTVARTPALEVLNPVNLRPVRRPRIEDEQCGLPAQKSYTDRQYAQFEWISKSSDAWGKRSPAQYRADDERREREEQITRKPKFGQQCHAAHRYRPDSHEPPLAPIAEDQACGNANPADHLNRPR